VDQEREAGGHTDPCHHSLTPGNAERRTTLADEHIEPRGALTLKPAKCSYFLAPDGWTAVSPPLARRTCKRPGSRYAPAGKQHPKVVTLLLEMLLCLNHQSAFITLKNIASVQESRRNRSAWVT
jgi:hypothetical protein